MTPKFLMVDFELLRRLPAKRKVAALLPAYRKWEPDATLIEVAAALGVSQTTIHRWSAWLDEAAAGTVTGTVTGAVTGAVTGTVTGALSSLMSDIKEGEREGAPAPLVSDVEGKTDHDAATLLVAAFMAHTTRRSVTGHEAHARILEDLRSRVYAARDLARYLADTPHTEAWPRELGEKVASYLEHLNLDRTEARRHSARTALRRRLRNVVAGEEAWPTAEAAAPPWTVIAVDADEGSVVVRLRTPRDYVYGAGAKGRDCVEEQTLSGPALAAWTFQSETMPLFAEAKGGSHE